MNLDTLLASGLIPDTIIRMGIRRLLRQRLREIYARGDSEAGQSQMMDLIAELRGSPIAIATDEANEQHYEVPAEFYRLVLGPNLKYSSAYYEDDTRNLGEAEENMLQRTVRSAALANGQAILELGCGWGSLTLYMARRYPEARITAVSNSRTQKEYIDAQARAEGLRNVRVITCDVNQLDFDADQRFDRIVSVEMFEHVRNYDRLFQNLRAWLRPQGRLFIHIFTHHRYAYPFEVQDESDWMARYFFTGGMMPSDHLFFYFAEGFRVVDHKVVNGTHYQKTAEDWLRNMDRNRAEIMRIFGETYGAKNARKWFAYWRVFFMSVAELFGYRSGREWQVSHYVFEPMAARQKARRAA
ncbi:MAG: class I SAM-dependent methyltransferase [Leptospiraceae bacterium]|nr:class I SAM-dependent methyltransferase [Leptospiraceae bacterium]